MYLTCTDKYWSIANFKLPFSSVSSHSLAPTITPVMESSRRVLVTAPAARSEIMVRHLKDKKKAVHVHAMVVPGSGLVKEQAEQEGLDKIFINAGFEWREPGCSMCLAMNADKLKPEERCASTSNRNFEGRQGRGGRTHLVSPGMAAAAAIAGNLDDVRKYQN